MKSFANSCGWRPGRWAVLLFVSSLLSAANAAVAPYAPDAHTVYLFHLDEAGGSSATNSAPAALGVKLVAFDGNNFAGDGVNQSPAPTVLGASGFAGFGNCANLGASDLGLGLDANDDGGFQLDDGSPVSNDRLPTHSFFGPGNEFTLEALINLPSITGGNRQIIATDHGGPDNTNRGLQFRITGTGQLEFNFVGVNTSSVTVPIPTVGPQAFAANEWFHVALVYDGTHASFFWTSLDSGATSANRLGDPVAEDVDVNDAALLVIGNEGRAVGTTGATEGLLGSIDEVRISNVARATNEFVFRSVVVLEASSYEPGSTNYPINTLDGNLNSRWSAFGDGEWITYDLGRSELVQSVAIAFYFGNTRSSTFDVLLSSDNASWQTVLTNAVSSGTTLSAETFDFADFPARYVRIVGHGNSQSLWNSLTEVVIQSSPVSDSDVDGLPDSWEIFYFTDLAQAATNDFDADTFSNFAEYNANSNPTNSLSTPLDRDVDGLPDAWEQTYFGSLSQTPGGDFDGDGYSNGEEHEAEANPANAAFTPLDTDGDGLPDAWEQSHFLSLAQTGAGDFDNDGYSNQAEYQGGTSPTNPASVPVGVVVNYVPIEDGDPNTSEYGYAGSSSINTVNFVHNALHTENGQQFIAYYYRHATNASNPNNNRIVIARRNINTNVWEMFFTTFQANAITDGHDVAAFGIDGDGYMHLSWGMHGDAFHYAKTTTSVFGTNAIGFGPDTTMTGRENSVTYPQWLRMPNGDLLYLFREGSSGNGDTFLNRYYVASQTWSNVHISGNAQLPFLKGTGWVPNYNAYPNMPQLDAAGNFYLVWTWRYQSDSPAGESGYQTNHDFDYARSTNGGLTWLRQNGVPYALPVSEFGENGDPATAAEKILSIAEGSSLINQAGMCLDTNNSPVIATWWAPGTGTNNFRRQYMVAFRDALGTWQVRQVSNRTNDPPGTKFNESFVRNLGRPVVVCDPIGRLIVLYRDNAGSNGLTIVHSLPYAMDPQRTNWTTFDLTTANLGNYEPVMDEARWELDQNLHIVYQPSQGEGYTPPANTAAQIGVVEWNAAAYFAHRPALALSFANNTNAVLAFNTQLGWGYRVQTSTNLTNWETLATLPGAAGQMQYTHTNGLGNHQRYWRLQSQEGSFAP
jgi:hypothetical protein